MLSTVHYFQLTVAHHCLQNICMGPLGKIPQCSKLIKSQSDDFLFGPTELEKVVRRVDESLDFPTNLPRSCVKSLLTYTPCRLAFSRSARLLRLHASHHVYFCAPPHKLDDQRRFVDISCPSLTMDTSSGV